MLCISAANIFSFPTAWCSINWWCWISKGDFPLCRFSAAVLGGPNTHFCNSDSLQSWKKMMSGALNWSARHPIFDAAPVAGLGSVIPIIRSDALSQLKLPREPHLTRRNANPSDVCWCATRSVLLFVNIAICAPTKTNSAYGFVQLYAHRTRLDINQYSDKISWLSCK